MMTTYTCDRCKHVFEENEFRHHIESTSESCSNGGKNLSWVLNYANSMGNSNDMYDHRSLDLCAKCYKKFLGLLNHTLTILEDDISVTDFVRRFVDIDGNVRIFVWDTSIHDKPYKNIIKELFGESTLSVHKFDAPLYYNTFAKYKFLAVTPCDPIDKFGPTVDIFARGPEDDTDTVCCGFDEDGKPK